MSNSGALSRMGFVFSDSDSSVNLGKILTCEKDVRVDGVCHIGGDLALTADINVGGEVFGGIGEFYLTGKILDVHTSGDRVNFVMPCDCYVPRVYAMTQGNATGDGVIKYTIGDTEFSAGSINRDDDNYNITLAAAAPGVTTGALAMPAGFSFVPAGGYFGVRVKTPDSVSLSCIVTVIARRA